MIALLTSDLYTLSDIVYNIYFITWAGCAYCDSQVVLSTVTTIQVSKWADDNMYDQELFIYDMSIMQLIPR